MSDIVRSHIVGITYGRELSLAAQEENRQIDKRLDKAKRTWQFQPPSPVVLMLLKDAGEFPAGLTVRMEQEPARVFLSRRGLAVIREHDVKIDIDLTDSSFENVIEAMNGVAA